MRPVARAVRPGRARARPPPRPGGYSGRRRRSATLTFCAGSILARIRRYRLWWTLCLLRRVHDRTTERDKGTYRLSRNGVRNGRITRVITWIRRSEASVASYSPLRSLLFGTIDIL